MIKLNRSTSTSSAVAPDESNEISGRFKSTTKTSNTNCIYKSGKSNSSSIKDLISFYENTYGRSIIIDSSNNKRNNNLFQRQFSSPMPMSKNQLINNENRNNNNNNKEIISKENKNSMDDLEAMMIEIQNKFNISKKNNNYLINTNKLTSINLNENHDLEHQQQILKLKNENNISSRENENRRKDVFSLNENFNSARSSSSCISNFSSNKLIMTDLISIKKNFNESNSLKRTAFDDDLMLLNENNKNSSKNDEIENKNYSSSSSSSSVSSSSSNLDLINNSNDDINTTNSNSTRVNISNKSTNNEKEINKFQLENSKLDDDITRLNNTKSNLISEQIVNRTSTQRFMFYTNLNNQIVNNNLQASSNSTTTTTSSIKQALSLGELKQADLNSSTDESSSSSSSPTATPTSSTSSATLLNKELSSMNILSCKASELDLDSNKKPIIKRYNSTLCGSFTKYLFEDVHKSKDAETNNNKLASSKRKNASFLIKSTSSSSTTVKNENHNSASSPTTPNHIANSGQGLSFVNRQQQISKLKNSSTMGSIRRYDPKNVQKIVLDWCMEQTKNYPNVKITNFSTSWADGLAFCALIHSHLPNAFDFNKLSPKNRRQNFELAFDVAYKEASIAPLLEVNDMLLMGNRPDDRCVFTYVSTIYTRFRRPKSDCNPMNVANMDD